MRSALAVCARVARGVIRSPLTAQVGWLLFALLLLLLAFLSLGSWLSATSLGAGRPWVSAIVTWLLVAVGMGAGVWQLVRLFRRRHWVTLLVAGAPWLALMFFLVVVGAKAIERAEVGGAFYQRAPVPLTHRDGPVLRVIGMLDDRVLVVVQSELSRGGLSVLSLTSHGGMGHVTNALAELVDQHDLEVHAIDDCASACANVWALARVRSAAPATRFAFHRPVHLLGGELTRRSDQERARRFSATLARRMAAAGMPREVIEVLESEGPNTPKVFTVETLQAAGVELTIR